MTRGTLRDKQVGRGQQLSAMASTCDRARVRNPPNAIVALLLAGFASAAFAGPACLTKNLAEKDPSTPLTYPMTSNRYAVQYRLDGGDWQDAKVYISYYGGTNASPLLTYKIVGYTLETSMSFVSIPARANANVQLRVTKVWHAPFLASDQVSVRPAAKRIEADLKSDGTVEISTRTDNNFAGEQFILWWDRGTESGGIEGLAFFLNPPYERPAGSNVKTIADPSDLTGDLSRFDTLDFEGTVAVGATGQQAFVVPTNINNVFLAPGAWVQGKLRFAQSGDGNLRRIYGPGVLDGSRFHFNLRFCDSIDPMDPTDVHLPDQSYSALSFEFPPADSPGIVDQFIFDGIVVSDTNHYATDYLNSTTLNNIKTISWNGNNDGLQFGTIATASNVFVRSGDDSLKMWGDFTRITNATVWQTWNGGVMNLGWSDNSAGENSLIDGVYVVKMDWLNPGKYNWNADTLLGQQDGQNNAVVASMMIPGSKFGLLHPSLYRNIYMDETPNVLFSLKILPQDCGLAGLVGKPCRVVDLTLPGVLNLNLEHVFTPASTVGNSIGFQNVAEPPINGAPLTGSMNINMTDVEVTPKGGEPIVLTSANAGTVGVGNIVTNGDNVNIDYDSRFQQPSGAQWYSAWTAPQIDRIATSLSGSSVRMIVRPTISGTAVRVKIENAVGTSPVTFSAAYIGQVRSGADLVAGSNTQLTFSGRPGLTLKAGAGAYSDPVTFPVTAFTRYAVSLDVITASDISGHEYGLVTNYVAASAHAADPSGSGFTAIPDGSSAKHPDPTFPVYWVAAVDVASASNTGTVVALGDSITDGACSTRTMGGARHGKDLPDLYNRWTDVLAARFAALPADQSKAVADEGIAGNLVAGGFRSALFRVADDVLGREGATHAIFLEGTNDIAAGSTASRLIAADQRIIGDAHQIGLKIFGVTIIPRGGDPLWTAAMEHERLELNEWIRHGGYFDAVIDFDALLQGPLGTITHLVSIPPKWSCWDGVHLNSDGYAVVGSSIDLNLFRTRQLNSTHTRFPSDAGSEFRSEILRAPHPN